MDDENTYNDSHRAFLQAFLARSTLTFETSKPILAAIMSAREEREVLLNDITEEDLRLYMNAVNMAITDFDYEIRSTLHQQSRERVFALVNSTSDPMTQMATTHSADEIAFLKRVLDWMFDGQGNTRRREAMCIRDTEAINLANPGSRRETQNGFSQNTQKLTMRDAEAMLSKLADEGWLERSAKGYYSLSPRALIELRGWLVDTYNDEEDDGEEGQKIKFCKACNDIVTVGQRCARLECQCRLHNTCTENFFRAQRNRQCPLCQKEWEDGHFVGEKSIAEARRQAENRKRSGVGGGSRRSQRQRDETKDVDEE